MTPNAPRKDPRTMQPRHRLPAAEPSALAVVLLVVGCLVFAAGMAAVYVFLLRGWLLVALGLLIAASAVWRYYVDRAHEVLRQARADVARPPWPGRAEQLAREHRHPSAGPPAVGPDEWDTAIIRLVKDSRGAA